MIMRFSRRPLLATLLSLCASTHGLPCDVDDGASALAARGLTTTAAASAPAATGGPVVHAGGPVACNNSPDLCNRAYNNITHMGGHDSAFLRDASTSNSISGNQHYNATVALSNGLRLLQAQVHVKNNQLQLCHTSCGALDAGTLQVWLGAIRFWMDRNPNEVVTLILVNSDSVDVTSYGRVFEAAGIARYGFRPASASGPTASWPSLASMIAANTRLVTFISPIAPSAQYPYLLNEFSYVFETPYLVTSLAGFTCGVDRPQTGAQPAQVLRAGMLPLLNHFAYASLGSSIQLPDVTHIDTTNSPSPNTQGALGTHARMCQSQWGVKPVFVLVDFWDRGPAMATADTLNGISAVGRGSGSSSSAPPRRRIPAARVFGLVAAAMAVVELWL